jgi:hypothetical protein
VLDLGAHPPDRLCTDMLLTLLNQRAALELDGNEASPDTFPLPTLGPKLLGLAKDVYSGRGFCVVRGLDLSRYSMEDATVIWLGMQGYIARRQGRQDKNGNMLGTCVRAYCRCYPHSCSDGPC